MKQVLEIQNYFRDKKSFNYDSIFELQENWNIICHIENDQFNRRYLHLDYGIGNNSSIYALECRGLVLSIDDNYNIVRYGFNRFFNHTDPQCDRIKISEEIFYEEKLDGSLIFLHWMPDIGWNVGTRGKLFPTEYVSGFSITFPELFLKTIPFSLELLDKNICYLFELCCRENRIVVPYEKNHVVLTGARLIVKDGIWPELSPDELDYIASCLNTKRPKLFKFNTIEECFASTKTLPGTFEGFVLKQLWPDGWHRIKVKGDVYKDLHNIVSSRSLNNLVSLVLQEKRQDIALFPDYIQAYEVIFDTLTDFWHKALNHFNQNFSLLTDLSVDEKTARKNFALAVKDTPYSNICFALANKRIADINDWLKTCNTSSGIKSLITQLDLGNKVSGVWKILDDKQNFRNELV